MFKPIPMAVVYLTHTDFNVKLTIREVKHVAVEKRVVRLTAKRPNYFQAKKLREFCIRRDYGSTKASVCVCCQKNRVVFQGESRSEFPTHLAHIKPISSFAACQRSEANDPKNLMVVCAECDVLMGTENLHSWRSRTYPKLKPLL